MGTILRYSSSLYYLLSCVTQSFKQGHLLPSYSRRLVSVEITHTPRGIDDAKADDAVIAYVNLGHLEQAALGKLLCDVRGRGARVSGDHGAEFVAFTGGRSVDTLHGEVPGRELQFAGLVHDVCKDDPKEKQLQMAEEFGIMLTESERKCPKLWHAIVGSGYTARFFTDDSDVIHAVRYHTTARKDMSLLEKIIYVADCVSADRSYPAVDKLRVLARKSLDGVIYQMVRITLSELAEAGMPLHEDTVAAYNQICLSRQGTEVKKNKSEF